MPGETSSETLLQAKKSQHQFYCIFCGKGFTRKEHLERHLPTHTGAKPYRCSDCHVGYNRKDLLQRHIQNTHHSRDGSDPMSHQVMPPNGHGIPIACLRCYSAKVKCDKEEPCDNCKKKGHKDCKRRYSKRNEKGKGKEGTNRGRFVQPQAGRPHGAPQPLTTTTRQYRLPQQQHEHPSTIDPTLMDVDPQRLIHPDHDLTAYYLPSGGQSDIQFNPVPDVDDDGQYYLLIPPKTTFSSEDVHNWDADFLENIDGSGSGSDFQEASLGYPSGQISLPPWGPAFTVTEPLPTSTPVLRDGLSEPLTQTTPASTSSAMATRRTSSATSYGSDYGDSPNIVFCPQSHSTILELQDVVNCDAAWPLARCTPRKYSGTCPKTAHTHLACFEHFLKRPDAWKGLEEFVMRRHNDNAPFTPSAVVNSVVPLTDQTRDHMMGITQQFLHRALESLEIHIARKPGVAGSPYVLLPPAPIVQEFLQSYVRGLSVYYPLVVGGRLDPNEMRSSPLSTLLLLLMIAQGAAAVPTPAPIPEARYLSTGLSVICRISVYDNIERNVALSAHPVALRCALLFTLLGAWSGDKWLMDIAMGQRNVYMSMLKHSGMLEMQETANLTHPLNEAQYKLWVNQESRNRLANNWAMLDQELALFHDTAPLLAVRELQCPIPAPEELWKARNFMEWKTNMAATYCIHPFQAYGSPGLYMRSTESVNSLFRHLLDGRLPGLHHRLTPQELRLLLHPIQAQVNHLREQDSCASGNPADGQTSMFYASLPQRYNETRDLLREWHQLAMATVGENPECPLMRCNRVMYHLICLNLATDFLEIEEFARGENVNRNSPNVWMDLSVRLKRGVRIRDEAYQHSNQVLNLLGEMPSHYRPAWWTAALYRAILILWANSLSQSLDGNALVAPCTLLQHNDGTSTTLNVPSDILKYGINMVGEADSSRFGDGIRRKLYKLLHYWENIDETVDLGLNGI